MMPSADLDRNQAIYGALHHPMRRKLLRYMDGLDEPMAASDYVKAHGVAGKTNDVAVSYVSYHLRQLEEAEIVDLIGTEAVRGATKHLYRISDRFTRNPRDSLALDQIATILGKEAPTSTEGMLRKIGDIVTSTGRTITSKDGAS
jgi:DNA-binding transcriptional ArsR family regulator